MRPDGAARCDRPDPLERIEDLRRTYGGSRPQDVLAGVYDAFGEEIALVSSFGADAAVLLHMVSEVDSAFPVVMLDTLMLFEETLQYQSELAERLGLRNLHNIRPDPADLAIADPDDGLHLRDMDGCCEIRKVLPLERAMARWPVTISGRKRFQAATRAGIEVFDAQDGRLRVNPLADWTAQDLRDYMVANDLPPHPLVARGYPSIGCAPCTSPVKPGEDPRAGRWRGAEKVECGIHITADGRVVRAGA